MPKRWKNRAELAQQTGGKVHTTAADMTKEADITRLIDAAKEKFGTVDILVNSAGQMYSGRFAAMTDAGLKEQFETKIFGFERDPSRFPAANSNRIDCFIVLGADLFSCASKVANFPRMGLEAKCSA